MFADFQSQPYQGSTSLSCFMVRGIMQSHRSCQQVRYFLTQHMADGSFFFRSFGFFIMFGFFSFFNWEVYFICMYGSSLMHFNLYCIIWEKQTMKSYVNLFINMLLSTAPCQGESIRDVLIDISFVAVSTSEQQCHLSSALHWTPLQHCKLGHTGVAGTVSAQQ